ncbi:hypothetical protein [Aidingimonas halophila]|uniref:Uncharacterized protein n=1 Tax=Aidingimonas halophila TaxID=574349 RepID=A0A1H2RPC2_9GAMM|nr:hypothetical protein [Aidingimonas halophila]GHC18919.1 hypothetical protein GCM10008094_06000 [Aidingimonas halophila]SDW21197.1 hypothetical protein SAMN05443545_101374 [Aidingimonas halophila]
MELTPTQAYRLGHLYHASIRQLVLSTYADEQTLDLAALMIWEQRLSVQGVPVPRRHRPTRFVALEISS